MIGPDNAAETHVHKRLLVRNLAQIVTWDADDGALRIVANGAVLFEESVRWIGPEEQLPDIPLADTEVVDARGGVMTPGLVESHTHLLYAGSREAEFVQRACGSTYQQISESGGGIAATVMATRAASHEQLLATGMARLDEFLAGGVTTVEVKSGYGLTVDDEIKMLEVIRELDRRHRVDVVPTFMAAHAVPPEYKDRRTDYVDLIIGTMIPRVAREGLAEFCDVFCDPMAFSSDEAARILVAARDFGLGMKVHAEQFAPSGGAEVAAAFGARSVEHLDYVADTVDRELASANVVAVLTPGVNLFLGLDRWPPARRLIDAGVAVALSTDFSPGACMTESLALIMTIACTRLKMNPEEVIRATTATAARAVGREASVGMLAPGRRGDAVIWAASDYAHVMYHFGVNHAMTVIKNGRVVVTNLPPKCFAH